MFNKEVVKEIEYIYEKNHRLFALFERKEPVIFSCVFKCLVA